MKVSVLIKTDDFVWLTVSSIVGSHTGCEGCCRSGGFET
jgi:hypothetical protein